LSLETGLRQAVERQEFELHYQPQVCLNTHQVLAVEGLLRWAHPEQGLIAPGRFIDLLEVTGLIAEVGEWVIGQACRDYRAICESSGSCRRIAINLSALQFRDAKLPLIIERALTEQGLSADCLEFEITESVAMGDAERVRHTLMALAEMGLRLSIDDFGTGYSSMSYLKRLPVDALKLALPFVQGLPEDRGDAGISRAVIGLAHHLGLEVVAEGVETEKQLKFLLDEQCDLIQGFLFSRGLPLAPLIELLKSGKSL